MCCLCFPKDSFPSCAPESFTASCISVLAVEIQFTTSASHLKIVIFPVKATWDHERPFAWVPALIHRPCCLVLFSAETSAHWTLIKAGFIYTTDFSVWRQGVELFTRKLSAWWLNWYLFLRLGGREESTGNLIDIVPYWASLWDCSTVWHREFTNKDAWKAGTFCQASLKPTQGWKTHAVLFWFALVFFCHFPERKWSSFPPLQLTAANYNQL